MISEMPLDSELPTKIDNMPPKNATALILDATKRSIMTAGFTMTAPVESTSLKRQALEH
jgi:hypothetical protein